MVKNKLTRSQKEAIGLLSIGTFLEYFDLFLYLHMAVLLNELFFPTADPVVAQLMTAFSFSSTFMLRPVGGYIIGKIGDTLGRKFTIMLTTFIMSGTCVVMATLPTYKEIGITASIIMIICRMLQGFSSLGEGMGAIIYMIEALKTPHRYIAVGIVDASGRLGGFLALLVGYFALFINFDFRLAFWIGAIIALIGLFARVKLRETPEFVDYQRRIKKKNEICNTSMDLPKPPIDKKAIIALFFGIVTVSISFYVGYVYIGNHLKLTLGMSPENIIQHNLKLAILSILSTIILTVLSKKYHPLRFLKFILVGVLFIIPFVPYFLASITNLYLITVIQFLLYAFISSFYNEAMWIKHFPVQRRFVVIATSFGVSTAIGYTIASFGLNPLAEYLGHYAILFFYVPCIIGFLWGLNYLKKLEIKAGRYNNYPDEDFPRPDSAANETDFQYDLGKEYSSFKNDCVYKKELLDYLESYRKNHKHKINFKLIHKAITYTKKWHDGQMRKDDKSPFYSHPFNVAKMTAEYYYKTDMIIAALLHDTVEDTPCTLEMIAKDFNQRIAEMVHYLTKIRIDTNGNKYKMTLKESIQEMEKVKEYEPLFIKEQDRLHNLYTIKALNKAKQKKIAAETNSDLIKMIAIIGDKIGIQGTWHLENKIFDTLNNILKSDDKNPKGKNIYS